MMSLPANIPKRGLSIEEAAEYCGVSRNTLMRHGPAPTRIGGRNVYDRKALDRWLDHLTGIGEADGPEAGTGNPLETAVARKNALRHQTN